MLLHVLAFALLSLTIVANELQYVVVRFEDGKESVKWASDVAEKYNLSLLLNLEHLGHPYYLYSTTNIKRVEPLLKKPPNGSHVMWALIEEKLIRQARSVWFNDERFPEMWYLNDVNHGRISKLMGINNAWALGYSGKGSTVSVVEDEFDAQHVELRTNYRPEASADIGYATNSLTGLASDHGTQMAGIIAAIGNNTSCGVGVSYNAGIGAIRLTRSEITDADEAFAFSYGTRNGAVDVFVAAKGAPDDGSTIATPGPLTKRAIRVGMLNGRHGRGSIYVWPSGNGGRNGDHCGADGFLSNIFTIAVASVRPNMIQPFYGERCGSMMTSAFSSPSDHSLNEGFYTAGSRGRCKRANPGTSISASVVAGIIAMGLEANKELTWRDVQYLLVMSSRKLSGMYAASYHETWHVNGAGFDVSDVFGFGMINAEAFVKMAQAMKYTRLSDIHACSFTFQEVTPKSPYVLDAYSILKMYINSIQCSRTRSVNSLEHVEIEVTLIPNKNLPAKRGNLQIFIESPSGARVPLLLSRPNDEDRTVGYTNWKFMTTLFWFEKAEGNWTVTIENNDKVGSFLLKKFKVILRGVWKV